MKILAMDIATLTGVAVGTIGSNPVAWSVDFGKGQSHDARFSKALQVTQKLIADNEPDLVAIEAPIGGPHANHLLIGLVACVRGCAYNWSVNVESYSVNQIRKHFLGWNPTKKHYAALGPAAATRAIKAEVIKRCNLLGWSPIDDNAADAMALFDYAGALHGAQCKPLGKMFNA